MGDGQGGSSEGARADGVRAGDGRLSSGGFGSRVGGWRLACLVLAALLLPVSNTSARLLLTPVSPSWQALVDDAYLPTPNIVVGFAPAQCPAFPDNSDVFGCTDAAVGASMSIWVTPGRRLDIERAVLLHEVGHVFDVTTMTPAAREEFEHLRHLEGYRWHEPVSSPNMTGPPSELFADDYSICAHYGHFSAALRMSYDWTPVSSEVNQICALIRRVGADAGLYSTHAFELRGTRGRFRRRAVDRRRV